MLKIPTEAEEKFGALLMTWWDGRGAARVLETDGEALLLEHAQGSLSLERMVAEGQDDEASRIICGVVAALHARDGRPPPPPVMPLARWFAELGPAAERHGGILAVSSTIAQKLLAEPRDVAILHGDIHHGNILHFGPRGWLAIDPKRLGGERGFDYANLFCNPKGPVPTAPGRLAHQVEVVAAAAGLERRRLLCWITAWAGLSAAWFIGDGEEADAALELDVARIAAVALEAL